MPDELAKAVNAVNNSIQEAPLPPHWKLAANIGAGLVTRVSEARNRARAAREAELRAFGIPFTDPWGIDANRRLQNALDRERLGRLDAASQRIDALLANEPKGGSKIPRASMAWEGKHPNDPAPGPALDGSADLDVGGE